MAPNYYDRRQAADDRQTKGTAIVRRSATTDRLAMDEPFVCLAGFSVESIEDPVSSPAILL